MQNNILETILVTKQLLHDFYSMKKRGGGDTLYGINGDQKPSGCELNTLLESMGTRNLLVMNILQIILLYIEVNKEIHTGSEQLEAE